MHAALAALDLDRLTVVYPGDGAYPLTERIRVAGLGALGEETAAGREQAFSPKGIRSMARHARKMARFPSAS